MRAPARTALLGRRHLLSVGGRRVSSYAVMLYLGCVAGTLAGAAFASARADLDPARFALATVVLLVPALFGARLWFVLQHLSAFRADPARLWRRSDGGASLYGGLVLGVAASVPGLRIAGLPFWAFWDGAAIVMLVGLILTRVGCLINGCCAGRETVGRLGVELPDHLGRWRRRYPTQLLEAGSAIAILVATLVAQAQLKPTGSVFLAVVAAYALARLAGEPLRESAAPMRERWVNLSFSAGLVLAAGALLVVRWGG